MTNYYHETPAAARTTSKERPMTHRQSFLPEVRSIAVLALTLTMVLLLSPPGAASADADAEGPPELAQTTSDADAEGPPELAQTTSIHALGSAQLRVTLPSDARIDPSQVETSTSAGQVSAMLIRPLVDGPLFNDEPALLITTHSDGFIAVSAYLRSDVRAENLVLPAGPYDVFLASEEPFTATLPFVGDLSSQASFELTEPVNATIEEPVEALDKRGHGPVGMVHSAGLDLDLDGTSLALGVLTAGFDAHTSSRIGGCLYFGHPSGPAPYNENCVDPSASSSPGPQGSGTAIGLDGSLLITYTTEVGAGEYGWGQYLHSGSVMQELDHKIITITY
jgi:hypothetical protein